MATTAAADTSIHVKERTRGRKEGPQKGFEKQPSTNQPSLPLPSTIFVFHLGRRKKYGLGGGCFRIGGRRTARGDPFPLRSTPIIVERVEEGVTESPNSCEVEHEIRPAAAAEAAAIE